MSLIYVDNISHFGLPVCFVVLFDFFDFTIRKNGSKKLYLVLRIKNSIKRARTYEMLTVAFGESFTGSSK